ncbi:MAG: FkbM family methyltransferase [Porticoccaceae bacterium]|nr:FkbM family methyltransferase [Porticoccaceae bacterium]
MELSSSSLIIDSYADNESARIFCDDFLHGAGPRYIFGRNEYASSIARAINIDGFIDDYTDDPEFQGKPIVDIEEIPKDALVVSAVVLGRPLTAQSRLKRCGVRSLDYFAFRKYAAVDILPVIFSDQFSENFDAYRDRFNWIYNLLQDNESKRVFSKLINFRLSSDLEYMHGFTDCQHRQYFEDFLNLKPKNEVFVDVGGFDGYTSIEFIKRCPDYAGVHIFEPEPGNMAVVKKALTDYKRTHFYLHGLSNRTQTLSFKMDGSASRISEDGDMEIKVERLDDTLKEPFSFLKMDVEGGEIAAIEGARQAIIDHHPRLAISAYHRFDDFWKIPEKVLSYRDDYQIFMRHYTEGVTETVMFFIPIKPPTKSH